MPASRLAVLSPEFSIAAAELWWTLVEKLESQGQAAHIKRRRDGTCAKHRDGTFAHAVAAGEEVRHPPPLQLGLKLLTELTEPSLSGLSTAGDVRAATVRVVRAGVRSAGVRQRRPLRVQ